MNDRASDAAAENGFLEAEFLCECAIEDCASTLRLPLDVYGSLKGNRALLIAHGPPRVMTMGLGAIRDRI